MCESYQSREIALAVHETPHLHYVADRYIKNGVVSHLNSVVQVLSIYQRMIRSETGWIIKTAQNGLIRILDETQSGGRILKNIRDVIHGLSQIPFKER
jgi:hypothetical protein